MTAATARAGKPAGSLIDGEFPLTRDDFHRIADIALADAGIDLNEAKASLVYSRLTKRLRTLRLESFASYCELLARGDSGAERQQMIAALTTNVTRFFREPHHFEHLKANVLPALIPAARQRTSIRIWSAACSSGEEPYSIALAILSVLPEAPSLDVKVLATDIDETVLAKGRAGIYSEEATAAMPAELRRRWFTRCEAPAGGKAWKVSDDVRSMVAFRHHNLMGTWPMRGPFDAIFCRNALIYFREESQIEVWCRFAPLLSPNGRLYIGHSERVCGDAAALYTNEAITTYRLRREPAR
jgi:chemotaxis protein methyltransferase CheR